MFYREKKTPHFVISNKRRSKPREMLGVIDNNIDISSFILFYVILWKIC